MARILIVDDDDLLRHAIARSVRSAGYDALHAADYRQALEILSAGKPEIALLLVDVYLPTINGLALARMARLKRIGIKVAYLTAKDFPWHEAIGPVIRKPVDPAILLKVVRAELAPSHGLRPEALCGPSSGAASPGVLSGPETQARVSGDAPDRRSVILTGDTKPAKKPEAEK